MEKIQSIEQLDALGAKICELLQVGIDKASVVVPETLQQIVAWQIWGNAAKSIIFIVLILILFNALKRIATSLIADFEKEDELFSAWKACGVTLTSIGLLFLLINFIFYTAPALIKALVAPNLVIIEQLGRLVK